MATVEQKGKVPMKDLNVGDRVLTAGGQYQVVYTINHFHETKPTNFLQIHTEMVGKKLENALLYQEVFPEYQFVFLGDSGQDDELAAKEGK